MGGRDVQYLQFRLERIGRLRFAAYRFDNFRQPLCQVVKHEYSLIKWVRMQMTVYRGMPPFRLFAQSVAWAGMAKFRTCLKSGICG
jgi:hypothetical protein